MIHFICDRCQRSMDPDAGPRYVIHIDVDVVNDSTDSTDVIPGDEIPGDEATDYLADLNDMLQSNSNGGVLGDHELSQSGVLEDEEALDYLNEILSRAEDCDFGDPHAPSTHSGFSGESDSYDKVAMSSKLEDTPTSFDLCPDCYAKYTQDPLSRDRALKLHFSNN